MNMFHRLELIITFLFYVFMLLVVVFGVALMLAVFGSVGCWMWEGSGHTIQWLHQHCG